MYETKPGMAEQTGASPEELAAATAEECFLEADLNNDGRLSFEEFQLWYGASGEQDVEAVEESEAIGESLPSWVSLSEVRRLTGLGSKSAEVVFEEFAQVADGEGLLSESAFNRCFRKIVLEAHSGSLSAEEELRVEAIVGRLFTVFDSDGDGSVDFSELASGLSVLCGGSADDKARSAFALYDYNGDGFISMEEMTRYLTAVFKV